ncbi:Mucin-associated surface protein (MASP) [Trypanosoma cruzi]|uniref:Mucin-associated surface protein (MASP), putative n=2 Tax=Trypanosoma cruzi TaxID=5693 RepID=Q4E287_TRYCC|nr:mucin-associated surface protein (MASP), putative [Trypanosoma cruzi]EAN98888.1 mucin-associated surface protein (MASP), putative [Trypanosoma cruzi]KAF8292003.1 Mucin-associated surface protein (MASP), subgroup S072 [Trypanosoma cruzi]PWV05532.1 Mucin-associated surface protein (MASP) [Trypanosoma cruzi]|eukprot:XP_820739.1 mucin-associated surface protein (MASP) [Trypanosoma cruzi strain CL Brener]
MTMMMTGRVLLVCALCVLWCGVCAVEVSKADASENTNVFHVPAEGPQPESAGRNTGQQEPLEHVSQERQNAGKPLDPKNEATDDQKRDLEIETPTADELRGEKEEVHKEQIDGGAGREKRKEILEERKAPPDGRGSEGGARQAGKGLAKVGVHSPATTPSGGERPGTSEPSPPESSLPAASTQEPGAAIPASLQEAPAATMKKKKEKTVENPRAEPGKEKLSSEDDVSEQTSQRVNDGVEPNNELKNDENVSVLLIEQNGESDGNSESTQARPLAVGDASNMGAEKGNEMGLQKNNPTDNGAVTEGAKRGENKHGNRKETSDTATITQTNETATNGDSDGSTAAFHTTSPLLLLLLVACAAAAVVAA